MDSVHEKIILNNQNQITSYEIDTGTATLGYIYSGQNKTVKINFELFTDRECDFIENAFYKNPILKEELINSKLNFYFFEYLLQNNITIIPSKIEDLSLNNEILNEEKIFIYDSLKTIFMKNPILALDIKGFDTDAMKEILAKQLLLTKTEKLDFIPIEKVKITQKNNLPEYYRMKKLYSDEIFANFSENPQYFDKKEFKSNMMELYDLIRDEFDNVFGYENNFFARNSNFYCIFGKKDMKFFVTPTINFEIYLKSKGSMFRATKEFKNIPVITGEKLISKNITGLTLPKYIVYDYFLSFQSLIESEEISQTTRFFNYLTLLAKDIVKTLNIRPHVIFLDEQYFKINYSVDFENPKLKSTLNSIIDYAAENYGISEDGKNVVAKSYIRELLDDIINYMVYKILNLKVSKLKQTPAITLFSQNQAHKSIRSNKNIAIAIMEWLNTFNQNSNPTKIFVTFEKTNEFEYKTKLCFNNKKQTFNLKELFTQEDENLREIIAAQIRSASEFMPSLKNIYCSFGYYEPIVNAIDIIKNLSKICSILNSFNVDIYMPKELQNILRPKLSIKTILKSDASKDFLNNFDDPNTNYSLNDIMEFSYEIAIGDEKLSKEEFLKLIENSGELINFKNKYVLLNEGEIKKILENLDKPIDKALNRLELIHSVFAGKIDDFETDYEDAIREAIKSHLNVKEVEPPNSLKDILRPYQAYGFKWLYSNIMKGFGCCIADDMGLGKTIQILSLILKLKDEKKLTKPALVVCPTTLVGNWLKECEKFAPELKVSIYHGINRILNLKSDVVITTYGHLRADLEIMKKYEWGMLIIDEAQSIKNPATAQSKAIKSLVTPCKIAMTGTPIENRLSELWSIFDFINKGYLGSSSEFQDKYVFEIEKLKQNQAAQRLQLVTSPFILRRLKTDKKIIDDLPEKIVFDEYCYLTPEQAALYESTLNSTMKLVKESSGINRRGMILKLITSLKQICNHPANYLKNQDFSYDLSGKTKKIFAIVDLILQAGEKVLIFTQYKEMGEILNKIIKQELHEKVLFFHGSLNRQERENLIEQFQNDDATKVMVLSLKAGGTGLNLTAATNVIHFDLWWNPAVETQATDRTYRIGQNKNVTVHRLITLGTFEEKIDEILKNKQKLVDMTLYTGETMLGDLSNEELMEIFRLR